MSSSIATKLRDAADALHAAADRYDAAQAAISGRVGGFKSSTPGASSAGPAPVIPCPEPLCPHIQPCPVHDRPAANTTTIASGLAALMRPDETADGHASAGRAASIVENLAFRRDPASVAALRAAGYLPNLALYTVRAVSQLHQSVAGWAPPPPKQNDACVSCERILDPKTELGTYTKRVQGSRYCSWCRKKKGDLDGHEPPLDMLARHLAGETITAAETTTARIGLRRSAGASPKLELVTAICPHPACGTELVAGEFACRPHWITLGSLLRVRLEKTWRAVKAGDTAAVANHEQAAAAAIARWESML